VKAKNRLLRVVVALGVFALSLIVSSLLSSGQHTPFIHLTVAVCFMALRLFVIVFLPGCLIAHLVLKIFFSEVKS